MDTTTDSKIKKMSPQLLVIDIDASIEFYTKKIGFDLDFRYEDFYAGISKDGHSIHLKSGKPSLEERQNKLANDDLDIVFSIEGVEDLYNDFINKSIQITQPLCDRPYGKEFYIADPDGYILAFLEEA
ncbi:VOC family protein [Parafilimonas terrae]|uniref:Catechol 2,3-dioxygenase n=1 Tax=Parafilimonas terrae TaxID=1465490 RepID=A0A1I5WAK6_9BACT|nr:VOC family protein [Parafilimonas terrae]SFQ16770.1 Catechol 2,3-dioxygenase [Parafilimonas terrae]